VKKAPGTKAKTAGAATKTTTTKTTAGSKTTGAKKAVGTKTAPKKSAGKKEDDGAPKKKKNKMDLALDWCKEMAEGTDVTIKSFGKSFGSGLAFCAVMHGVAPDRIPMDELTAEDRARNFELAFSVAEDLGQPRFLEVDDCLEMEYPDKLSTAA
jgi:hypothetical protein